MAMVGVGAIVGSQASPVLSRLVRAARKLEARGHFAPHACADAGTASDLAEMRSALSYFGDDA